MPLLTTIVFAGDDKEALLQNFEENARKHGTDIEQTRCLDCHKFYTTAWSFDGAIVSTKGGHKCTQFKHLKEKEYTSILKDLDLSVDKAPREEFLSLISNLAGGSLDTGSHILNLSTFNTNQSLSQTIVSSPTLNLTIPSLFTDSRIQLMLNDFTQSLPNIPQLNINLATYMPRDFASQVDSN